MRPFVSVAVLPVAVALGALLAAAPAARAAVISGTWAFSVSDWGRYSPPLPPGPITGSASFGFDDAITTPGFAPLSVTAYSSDFGAGNAAYHYDAAAGSLTLLFGVDVNCCADRGGTHYIVDAVFGNALTSPVATEVQFFDADSVLASTTDVVGGFTRDNVSVPEPGTLAVLATLIAALGAIRQLRLRPR